MGPCASVLPVPGRLAWEIGPTAVSKAGPEGPVDLTSRVTQGASLCLHPVPLAFPGATPPSPRDFSVLGAGVCARTRVCVCQEGENVLYVYFKKKASVFLVEYLENINVSHCLTPSAFWCISVVSLGGVIMHFYEKRDILK